MRRILGSMAVMALLFPLVAQAQDVSLADVSKALGADGLRSIQITGSGVNFAVGQSATPAMAWPRFNVKSFVRTINYDTASLRDELVRTQGENPPRGGGQQPIRGEQRQIFVVNGDHAWNVMGDAAIPAPMTLADRQFQLWATPHGVIKAASTSHARVQGRTIIFGAPGRFTARATIGAGNLIEKVEAVLPNAVLGDLPVEVTYADYKDFGGVKFPTRIRQSAGGHPALDLTVTDVRPGAPADLQVPDPVRQATAIYTRIATQMVADGIWYVTGGTHHSAVIEMSDHVIVVEGPLNDARALAVIGEVRSLVPGKPIKYLVNTHHHFDHAGGVRAFAAEGATIVTHEVNRAFFERTLATRATVDPDHLTTSGRKATVEGVGDRRVLTDGTRTVEIHHIAGNPHHDGLIMVYLPKEKLLVEADAFTPGPAGAPRPDVPNPFSVNLADAIKRLKLDVTTILPLHGRIVPLAELHKAIGHDH